LSYLTEEEDLGVDMKSDLRELISFTTFETAMVTPN